VTRVLVLRAREDAERTATRLRAMGFDPILSPVLDIVATGAAAPEGRYDAVLASSAKGLEYASDSPDLRALPLHVVGATTALAATRLGWPASIIASTGRLLASALTTQYAAPAKFLYLAGHDRQDDLENRLRRARHIVTTVETYEARAAQTLSEEASAALAAGAIAAVLHYSRRSAEIFLALARAAGLEGALAASAHLALSDNAAEPLRRAGLPALVAARPDEAHLLKLLEIARLNREPSASPGASGPHGSRPGG
jgi:uroporphyrinogen-III synthase